MSMKSPLSFVLRCSCLAMLALTFTLGAAADQENRPPISDAFADLYPPTDEWYEAGDATLDPNQSRLLIGKPGTGVLINGKTGRANSLVTKDVYQDVQVHVEFMVAKGSNSGVIFHGNYEIQILDSAHEEKPTGAHCGGVYPRAEGEPGTPSYHHIDKGSPPRVNAAKAPGQWQTMDIIFQSPRFESEGNKTANARFVRVVHNGLVVQENVEMPYAHGPNWNRKQFPEGRVVFQGDYGPIAFRNIRVRPWDGKTDIASMPGSHRRQTVESDAPDALASVATKGLNSPPEGFTALFNGRDFSGWQANPKVKEMWSIEDGVLKSHGLLEEWGADLSTDRPYRDFVLMLDFRMPTISDSGISFRRLIPEIPGFGNQEQFNLRSKGGMGHLESYYFLPKETASEMGLKEEEKPQVRHIDPEVGVWHTVKLTVQGRTLSAEYDGDVLIDCFKYHDWMLDTDPAPIRLQKHKVVHGENLGEENPCPIEYRNIFIKELGAKFSSSPRGQTGEGFTSPRSGERSHELLDRIDASELPKDYVPAKHQEYVDRRLEALSDQQRGRISELWKEKQRIDPDMPNRGFFFVKILAYVADREGRSEPPAVAKPGEPQPSALPNPHPVNQWNWPAERDGQAQRRKAVPIELPDDRTIHVASFELAKGQTPPVVLLPESRLKIRGRIATAESVYFGITIQHPNGDFAGRFVTGRGAESFEDGADFEMTLDLQDLQLDPSLAEMKDKLPNRPFHFVIESIWLTTLEEQAGLEITEVRLEPRNTRKTRK